MEINFKSEISVLFIGVGRLRILGGGAKVYNIGGPRGGQIPSRHRTSKRRHDVVMTSMRRNDVASTSHRRHFDVLCPLDF